MNTKATASIPIFQTRRFYERIRAVAARAGIILLLVLVVNAYVCPAAEGNARHYLQVELFPEKQTLQAVDQITIEKSPGDRLDFKLSRRAEQIEVTVNRKFRKFDFENGHLQIGLTAGEKNQKIQITIRYTAIFDDPAPIRPLNADNPGYGVSATISERGCFLLAGSGWYPQWAGGHSIYTLNVIAPEGMLAVTAGQSEGHKTENGKTESTWLISDPIRGLSLSVGAYILREKKVGSITAATYFFPETDHLAEAYLAATANYLDFYQDLFGPYPFKKFAVVENFFPTGFGFPSYTLIGGTVLRLPFIIRTSLGHEIAHCWWGNGVLVDYDGGNWSEALTTYVADYHYKAMKSEEEARGHRLQILRNYATLVKPARDFALKQFQSRSDPITKTIGYDKGAMVFHMLRRQVGEEAFWGALRDLYRDRLFKTTSWTDIQKAFEARGPQSLKNFFDQWVFHKGAPRFYLDAVRTRRTGGIWQIEGRIVQESPPFSFDLDLLLESHGQTDSRTIRISERETPFQITSKSMPLRLVADPDSQIMRRLFPIEIPPAINAMKSSSSVLALLSADLEPRFKKAARTLVLSLGLKNYAFAEENNIKREQLLGKDIMMIGYPQNKALLRHLPDQIAIAPESFVLNEKTYQQSSDVFFGVFAHPFSENRIVALFFPLSSHQAENVARKITHYGKYSYLAFENGQNRAKGFWPVEQSPLEYRWKPAGAK
ncbi:MAG: M1 family aminopeptidase [Desulfobacterales bacterium]|nr:M1 family aminopeptidase [Desulfobacterales bacterium]